MAGMAIVVFRCWYLPWGEVYASFPEDMWAQLRGNVPTKVWKVSWTCVPSNSSLLLSPATFASSWKAVATFISSKSSPWASITWGSRRAFSSSKNLSCSAILSVLLGNELQLIIELKQCSWRTWGDTCRILPHFSIPSRNPCALHLEADHLKQSLNSASISSSLQLFFNLVLDVDMFLQDMSQHYAGCNTILPWSLLYGAQKPNKRILIFQALKLGTVWRHTWSWGVSWAAGGLEYCLLIIVDPAAEFVNRGISGAILRSGALVGSRLEVKACTRGDPRMSKDLASQHNSQYCQSRATDRMKTDEGPARSLIHKSLSKS